MTVLRPSLIGAIVPRLEDDRLLAGQAAYVADIKMPGMVEAAIVRSPVAHGIVEEIEVDEALAVEGVIGVFTADDLTEVSPFPDFHPEEFVNPVKLLPLGGGRVRFVGTPLAVVVAGNRYQAEDGRDAVMPDVDPLPVVTSVEEALAPDAALLYPEWADNRLTVYAPQSDAVDEAFAAHQVVSGRYGFQRHGGVPMETRGVLAEFRDGRLTVWSSTQFPHIARTLLSYTLGLSEDAIRVMVPDIGGGFGVKAQFYPEEVLIPWVAMRLGRPVRWIEDRREHMVSSVHARETYVDLEAAVDSRGRFLALRGMVYQDAGSGEAIPAGFAPAHVTAGGLTGPYKIPLAAVGVTSVVTNKTPSGAYRGFGAPEAAFAMERLMDKAANKLGLDRLEVRRRNLLERSDLPYTNAVGSEYDSGSHRLAFERLVEMAEASVARWRKEYEGVPTVRVGTAATNYVEGGTPTYFGTTGHWASQDAASVRMNPDGSVVVLVGVQAMGQGLVSMLTTLTAESLGVPATDVRVVMGDTDRTPYSLGAWGSRSTNVASGALEKAVEEILGKGLLIAAHLLEASPDDLEIQDGGFGVKGSPDSRVSWKEVATTANILVMNLPDEVDPGLEATAFYDPPGLDHVPDADGKMNACAAYTNASQAAVVKVDITTGHVELLDYLIVHDCGTLINPLIVEGQIAGGIAQGIGGAILEEFHYDEYGNPQSTSFLDYHLPSAAEVPPIHIEHIETPSLLLPWGAKGVGEAGIVGPAPAIAAAVEDALAEFDIEEITRTPISPPLVLRLIQRAGRADSVGA